MKSLHIGHGFRGRALSSRIVSFPRSLNVALRMLASMASTRYQSSTTDRVTASPWSKHPLPVAKPSFTSPKIPSSRNGTAKRTAYIALGSNLGDRISWIEKACSEMSARGIEITRTSSLWETEPMYVLDQDRFVNGACEVSASHWSRYFLSHFDFGRLQCDNVEKAFPLKYH